MTIAYSDKAKTAYAYLYQAYNDIDIYVEDTSTRALYENLFRRMLDGRARLARVHQVGTRASVLLKCATDQAPSSQPKIYIIDGDMDHFTGRKLASLRYLYRLGTYCSENLLICKDALEEIAFDCACNLERGTVRAQLNLEQTFSNIEKDLLPLFILYAIVHKKNLGIETISYSVFMLMKSPREKVLCRHKIYARMRDLTRRIVKEIGSDSFREEKSKILKLMTGWKGRPLNYMSGKDYILPLLFEHLKSKVRLNDTKDQIKPRLARHCRLDADMNLQKALFRELESGKKD
ncbi:DUF4435 domain-containing protein [Azospirillum sp. CT11-132]|uniref:DUF4435 domain-containing protein n=1 Tax=Azospirillum sp. CT11-132 TaxID=3396317 RepID=UPI0039A7394E